MRGNEGTHRLKGFDVWPIVTCDDAIVTAKRHGLKGFNVQPLVTCDDVIITAWVCGSKGFDMQLIVLWNWVSPDTHLQLPLCLPWQAWSAIWHLVPLLCFLISFFDFPLYLLLWFFYSIYFPYSSFHPRKKKIYWTKNYQVLFTNHLPPDIHFRLLHPTLLLDLTCSRINMVVVLEFCKQKELVPVVLPLVDEDVEVLF